MRKTDISKYNTTTTEFGTKGETGRTATGVARSVLSMIGQGLKTVFCIIVIAGVIVFVTLLSYIMSMRNEAVVEISKTNIDLKYTSFVYTPKETESGELEFEEYMHFYNIENRVWVDYKDIPDAMIDAITAIEDKRFWEHEGVDWKGVGAAVYGMVSDGARGGSTITQQLIKNITGDDDVSINRKFKEIFRALNLEKKYSKQQILESYLNIVAFGVNRNGVQSAANAYFGKDIKDCSIAECASIAGITQMPYYYDPLYFPENNKEKAQVVLDEMFAQEKITEAEYTAATKELKNMTFQSSMTGDEDEDSDTMGIWNWYIDDMFEKVSADLQEALGVSEEKADMMIYQGGIKIYSAMDPRVQGILEDVYSDPENRPEDLDILSGIYVVDYSGRVLGTVGSLEEKDGNRVFSMATDAARQSGSCIKPVSVYAQAIELGLINYSSIIKDEPLPNYFPDGSPGPYNYSGTYAEGGKVTVELALETSLNAPAAQLVNTMTPEYIWDILKNRMGFNHLNEKDINLAALSLGGVNGGITVEEITSAFQIFGNGGIYNEPYMYYYVEDHDGNVILDNREKVGEQVISSETSTIMNKLLRNVMYGAYGTASGWGVSGWDTYGKTGTTDFDDNSWLVGGTPYCVAGVWIGYDVPERLSSTRYSKTLWHTAMTKIHEGLDPAQYSFVQDPDVVAATYCEETGLLAGTHCKKTATGWYVNGKLPSTCKDEHNSSSSDISSEVSSDISSEISSALSSEVSSTVSSEVSSKPVSSKPVSSKPVSSEPASSEPSSSEPVSSEPASSEPVSSEPSSSEPVSSEPASSETTSSESPEDESSSDDSELSSTREPTSLPEDQDN